MSEAMQTDEDYLDELGLERPEADAEDKSIEAEAVVEDVDPALPREGKRQERAPEPDETDEEPEPIAAKEPESREVDVEQDSPDDLKAALEEEKKRNAAILAELSRVRKANAERERQEAALKAPRPTQAQEPAKPEGPTPIGVMVDEQSNVMIDQAALDAYLERKAPELIDRRLQPSPEQQRIQARANVLQQFVSEQPERNRQVAEDMMLADQFLGEAIKGAMAEYNYQPQGLDDLMQFADTAGITGKMRELFPAMAPHLRQYIAAIDSGSPEFLGLVMRQVASGYGEPERQAPQDRSRAAHGQLRSVDRAPRSLGKVGGDRTLSSESDDEREFGDLDKRYRDDPIFGITDDEHKRWRQLGSKLGKPGFSDRGI